MHSSIIDVITFGLLISDRRQGAALSFFGWLFLGMFAGYIVNKLLNRPGHGMLRDMLLGIVGGLVGGFLANLFRAAGVENVNLYSFFVAFIGAVVFLISYHARCIVGDVRRRRS
jgi:uncharacterized membrane protein YeaQ/YmgE (transglycosylase-associated protein family)